MGEATVFFTGKKVRGLFVPLILDGAPAPKLWQKFETPLEEDLKLQLHEKSNEKVNFSKVSHREPEKERANNAFDRSEQTLFAQSHSELLTSEQRTIYTTVIDAVNKNKDRPFMIDVPAGTGKKFAVARGLDRSFHDQASPRRLT